MSENVKCVYISCCLMIIDYLPPYFVLLFLNQNTFIQRCNKKKTLTLKLIYVVVISENYHRSNCLHQSKMSGSPLPQSDLCFRASRANDNL